MDQSGSGELKPPSRHQRNDAEILSVMKAMRDFPGSRPFRFKHGYVLLRSRTLTVIVQSLLVALGVSIILGFEDSLMGIKHDTWIHILHFRIPRTYFWLILTMTVIIAVDTAVLVTGVSYRLRRLMFPIVLVFILVTPTSLFH